METDNRGSNERRPSALTTPSANTRPRLGGWERWVKLPQSLWFRRALFQIHLWVGIAIGLYIISVSGSAVVFRRELARWLMPRGTELENGFPPAIRVMEWLVDLHDNLLAGALGRDINGIFALLITVLVLTGAVIWWPGRRRWRRSVTPVRSREIGRFSWHLHSSLGLWGFVLLFSWAITGVYFAFPEPFEWAFNHYDTDPTDYERPGEGILLVLIRWHFGRFGGLSIRILWVILGLLPAILFATGFIVWWKRVVSRALQSRA
jgi:uncharacterized iron-regulated membrane protein